MNLLRGYELLLYTYDDMSLELKFIWYRRADPDYDSLQSEDLE